MRSIGRAAALLAAVALVSGCGKVLATLAKGVSHEADHAGAAAFKSAAPESAEAGGMAAAQHVDDSIHGPAPIDDAAEGNTSASDQILGAGKAVAEQARDELIQRGVESAVSGDDDNR